MDCDNNSSTNNNSIKYSKSSHAVIHSFRSEAGEGGETTAFSPSRLGVVNCAVTMIRTNRPAEALRRFESSSINPLVMN